MSRGTDGLVQRRNVSNASQGFGGGGQDSDVDLDEKSRFSDSDEDRDRKETRLTLMEEILLLGLKDKEVRTVAGD